MAEFDQLITKALANGLGPDQFDDLSIQCLDSRLHGHAFKYHEKSANIFGVYPYQITYITKTGGKRTIDVMVKAKPDQQSIIRVYQNLLDHCGIKLKGSLTDYLKNSDYETPNF